MTRRLPLLVAPCVLIVVLLGGCVTPATGSDSYAGKARLAVDAATSEVATAAIAVEQVLAGRLMRPYADETVTAGETALGAIEDSFGSVQPPPQDDALREAVTAAVSEASDAVTAARISVRRSDRAGMREALADLRRSQRALGLLAERLA